MHQNIALSEVLTIDTKDNKCALAFSFELLGELSSDTNMLLTTSNDITLVQKNLEILKESLSSFEELHQRCSYLFLKNNWDILYEQYGLQTFQNELLSLTEDTHYDVYYFHRIDLFFDTHFTQKIKNILYAFIDAVRYHHKKVIFSYNTHTLSGKSFEMLLENRRDLSFHNINDKIDDCNLKMKTHNRLMKKENASIVVISDQEDIDYLHKTIFAKQENINYTYIQLETLIQADTIINEQTDLIIYNDSKKPLNKNLIKAFKQTAPFAQIYVLSNRRSIRKIDLKISADMGIDQTFAKSFDIKEYVQHIEQVIHNNFYTHKLKNISFLGEIQRVDVKGLMQRLTELEKTNILFTMMTAQLSDTDTQILNQSIREDDFFFIDSSHNLILFVMLNILPEQAKDIIAERMKVNKLLIKHHKIDTLPELVG